MKKNKERNVIKVKIMVPAGGKSDCDWERMCMYVCVSYVFEMGGGGSYLCSFYDSSLSSIFILRILYFIMQIKFYSGKICNKKY